MDHETRTQATTYPPYRGVDLPLDGVKGPGFYAPNRDGTFDVPRDILAAASGRSASQRAGTKLGNKGRESAVTALEMVDLLRNLQA